MGDMDLELPLKGIKLCGTKIGNPCLYMQGLHLRPREYFSHGNWRQLDGASGEVDVTPEAGVVECGLAPLMTDMSNTHPCQMAIIIEAAISVEV